MESTYADGTRACSLTSERLLPNDYEEIYIHTKVAILDDAALTAGSTNLNLRSMALDSELNLLSNASDLAYDLRTRLFAQCTKNPGPAIFHDMTKTFEFWKSQQDVNRVKMEEGRELVSQLLPFQVDRKPGSSLI